MTTPTGSDYAPTASNGKPPPVTCQYGALPRLLDDECQRVTSVAERQHACSPMTVPTGSAYVTAVAEQLAAAGIGVDMREADLDEERCNLPIRDTDGGVTWLRWAYDNGWYLDDDQGWPCAPICPPDTPVDEAAKRLADYL